MPTAFLVELTQVRPLSPGDPGRDERVHPEIVLESLPADGPVAAHVLFTAFSRLSSVKQGRQRSKLILLAGTDTASCPSIWGAPLITHRAGEGAW